MVRYRRQMNEMWEDAANRLLLEFQPEKLRQRARIEGRVDGHAVAVVSQGWGKSPLRTALMTLLTMGGDDRHTLSTDPGLSATFTVDLAEDVPVKLVHRRFAARRLREERATGDEAFDAVAVAFAEDPAVAGVFMTPRRRDVAREALEARPDVTLGYGQVTYHQQRRPESADEIVATVTDLVTLARSFVAG